MGGEVFMSALVWGSGVAHTEVLVEARACVSMRVR